MRANGITLLVAAMAIAGCSSDHSGGSRNDVPGASGSAAPASGASGAASAKGAAGNANPGFFNPTQTSTAGSIATARDAGGVPVSDGSPCIIGQFCQSQGPDMGCGTLTLASTVKMTTTPGNLLIIMDQSASMQEMWTNGTKLDETRMAIVQAITPLQDSMTIGAIFLPDPEVGCLFQNTMPAVQPIEGTGNIPFMPGPQFLQAFANHWSMYPQGAASGSGMGLGTPLNEAFDRADIALKAAIPMLTGKVAVMVFTDGMPNCSADATVTKIPTETEPQRAADWLAQGLTTYVVGLPDDKGMTGMGMDGSAYLNSIAVNGGSMMYITPDQPMVLTNTLSQIVQMQVSSGFDSCSIDLMPPTTVPDKLQLVVEEPANPGMPYQVPHDLGGTAGGWMISTDGAHVDLTGGVCDSAKMGRFSKLTFEFGCKDIPVIPPSHVM